MTLGKFLALYKSTNSKINNWMNRGRQLRGVNWKIPREKKERRGESILQATLQSVETGRSS
jgi:hypothetical protein